MTTSSLPQQHSLLAILLFCTSFFAPFANATSSVDEAHQLLKTGKLEPAAELIESTLERNPDDAAAHYMAGLIYGEQAQQASVFKAPGLARKTKQAFERAVQLDPNTIKHRFALMSFYFIAPGVVGGDDDLGSEQVSAITKLNPAKGYQAKLMELRHLEDEAAVNAHFDNAPDAALAIPSFRMQRGIHYQSQEKFDLAMADFEATLELPPENESDLSKYAALYQIGRTGVMSSSYLEKADAALIRYAEQAPSSPALPPRPWVFLRQAQLKLLMGDKTKAQKMYAQAQSSAQDKQLKKELKKLRKEFL